MVIGKTKWWPHVLCLSIKHRSDTHWNIQSVDNMKCVTVSVCSQMFKTLRYIYFMSGRKTLKPVSDLQLGDTAIASVLN